MYDTKKYITCPTNEKTTMKVKSKDMNKTHKEMNSSDKLGKEIISNEKDLKSKPEAKRNESGKKNEHSEGKKKKEPERGSSLTINNDKDLTVMYFKKPIFVKITIRPTRKLEDMKVSANNGEHTFLIYNRRLKKSQFDIQEEIKSDQAPHHIKVSSNKGAFNKLTTEKMSNGTIMFLLELSQEGLKQDSPTNKYLHSVDYLAVYISDEKKKKKKKKKEEHLSITPHTGTIAKKDKVTYSRCFYIKTDSNNTRSISVNQVETFEQVRKGTGCHPNQTIIEEWLMDDVNKVDSTHQLLRDKNAHSREVKPESTASNLVTCGILTFELSRENKCESRPRSPENVFVFVIKTQKRMDENGKEVGGVDKIEDKLRKREILQKSDENAQMIYEIIELMEPAFKKNVQAAIADVKDGIIALHGESILNNAEYKSELKIIRRVACTDNGCQGFIKAVLQYNLTRKAKLEHHMATRPKGIFKILMTLQRFQFDRNFLKQHNKLPMFLIKRKYPDKYSPKQMPMTKLQQAVTKIKTTKNELPSLVKVVPGSLSPKMYFKAAGTRCPFAKLFSKLSRRNEKVSKYYQQKRAQYNQREEIPSKRIKNPLFQVIRNNNNNPYRDGEVVYHKEQLKEVLKKTEENRPIERFSSGSALTISKCIIIAVIVYCFFLFEY